MSFIGCFMHPLKNTFSNVKSNYKKSKSFFFKSLFSTLCFWLVCGLLFGWIASGFQSHKNVFMYIFISWSLIIFLVGHGYVLYRKIKGYKPRVDEEGNIIIRESRFPLTQALLIVGFSLFTGVYTFLVSPLFVLSNVSSWLWVTTWGQALHAGWFNLNGTFVFYMLLAPLLACYVGIVVAYIVRKISRIPFGSILGKED